MAESAAAKRKARGLERFLLFSDGVSAIAVTLLVLPLVDAVLGADGEGYSTLEILEAMGWEMFSFVLSFVVIIMLWMGHQQVFQGVASYDQPLLRTGIVWLFSLVMLPFSTALIADHGAERTTALIYIFNLAVAVGSLTFATWHLYRRPHLMNPGDEIKTLGLYEAFIDGGLVVLAFVLVALFPALGYSVLLLLLLNDPLLRVVRKRWASSESSSS